MRPIRIAIRQQLSALVCICVLLSLGILAIVLTVVTQNYVLSLRSERMQLVAELKASQASESIVYYYSQAFSISTRDTIQNALGRYRAGNHSAANWEAANTSFQVSLNSEDNLIGAAIYSLDFTSLLNATNNFTDVGVADDLDSRIFPLQYATEAPTSLSEKGGIISGPFSAGNELVLSLTIPIMNNTKSGNYSERVSGYLTVVFDSAYLMGVVENTVSISDGAQYSLLGPASDNSESNTVDDDYVYLLPPTVKKDLFRKEFPYSTYPSALKAIINGDNGCFLKSFNSYETNISVGYSPVDALFAQWAVTVEVYQDDLYGPIYHLRNIALVTVFSLAAVMCIITLPLAHFAVRPIVRLRLATAKTTDPPAYHHYPDSASEDMSSMQEELRTSSFRVPDTVPERKHHIFTDELTELTSTFNNMARELRKQYENLEDRVHARTRELEAAMIQAEAANEAKSVFIANITHELRTPLNGILGMTAVSMTESDMHKIQKSLKIIYKSGELLLHLLTDLLIFSRNQLGKVLLEEKEFKVSEIVSQIKAIFEKQASSVKVSMSVELIPSRIDTMVLYGDANRIIQILINLISNGLKFTQENGSITVKLICHGVVESSKNATNDLLNEKFDSSNADLIERAINNSEIYASESKNFYVSEKNESLNVEEVSSLDEKRIDHVVSVAPNSRESRSVHRQHSTATKNSQATSPVRDSRHSSRGTGSLTSSLRRNRAHALSLSQSLHRSIKTLPQLNGLRSISPLNNEHAVEEDFTEKYLLFEFQVEDTGPGISEPLQQKIFEPFIQGDQALSKKYGGAGLGLSICKQLAELMGGTIEVDSIEGMGATFIFRVRLRYIKDVAPSITFSEGNDLPTDKIISPEKKNSVSEAGTLAGLGSASFFANKTTLDYIDDDDTDADSISSVSSSIRSVAESVKAFMSGLGSTNSTSKTSPPLDKLENKVRPKRDINILVVEDNKVNQQVVKRMLQLEKINYIAIAKDGNDAVEKIKSTISAGNYFDVVFMDIQMPNLDGLQATRIIRQDLDYKYPIVALTAYADDSNVKECMDAGMNNFLTKPIKRPQLYDILNEYCHLGSDS
ncbi:hypothetical protein V1514DRAFT_366602 [Lipomyces japonicus]|uniref:uncharacterized protein n=1 Tax=Lipomyces japonicus TaxID=56871 RepID=UPI0034CF16AD